VHTEDGNPWYAPNLLLQKFPGPEFTATVKIEFYPDVEKSVAGLLIMGQNYSYIGIRNEAKGLTVGQYIGNNSVCGGNPRLVAKSKTESHALYLKVNVNQQAICSFSYSRDGKEFTPLGRDFTAAKGKWIGAKVGLFSIHSSFEQSQGFADIDWFHVE
jgi:beta-xylosidase